MEIKVNQATIKDLPILAPLFDQYRQFYDRVSDVEAGFKFLQGMIERKDSVIYLATTIHNEAVIGLGFVQLYPYYSSVQMKRGWYLNDLFVNQAIRGKGVGKLLLKAVQQLGKETNAAFLFLETQTLNSNAQKLYKTMGFSQVEDQVYFYYNY